MRNALFFLSCSLAVESQLHTTVFVTSSSYTGDLGGLAGSDMKCQEAAESADLVGTYVAWLSALSENAVSRIPQVGPYRLVDGKEIAKDLADLTDGRMNWPINTDENGAFVHANVWTGTLADGTIAGFPTDVACGDWEIGIRYARFAGEFGASVYGNRLWTAIKNSPLGTGRTLCDALLRLYCFGTNDQ